MAVYVGEVAALRTEISEARRWHAKPKEIVGGRVHECVEWHENQMP
jgi:hypothetical protein